jgi:hypothetical protein
MLGPRLRGIWGLALINWEWPRGALNAGGLHLELWRSFKIGPIVPAGSGMAMDDDQRSRAREEAKGLVR